MEAMGIFDFLSAAAGGGLFGLIGVGVKQWFDRKAEQAKYAHELAMRKLDQDEIKLEHQLHMQQVEAEASRDIAIANQTRITAEVEAQAEVEQAEIQLRQASYDNDRATYGGGWVDDIRGLMRPVITLYYTVLMSLIAWQLNQVVQTVWEDQALAQAMFVEVIRAIVFLTTTSVTWWFGSRPVKSGSK